MNSKNARTYSRYTKEAALLLGRFIQLGRKSRKLSESDLADRIGISRTTLQKIEKGSLTCEIGIVLEAAALVGVKLFEVDSKDSFESKLDSVNDKLAFLPRSVRKSKEVDDDF
jgi:DNA-binding XRE family transcriptional regulator